ncbi:MAG: phosphatase PAP2 family protein [Rhodoferax sp.]|nr:phosphatase PAP2 family protein [Rhodoferax sp.]
MFASLLRRGTPKWFLAGAAVLVLGGAWLFLGILEDVATRDPLVHIDAFIHDVLLTLRTPDGDHFWVAVTELGDVQVVLPVIVVALGWFLAHRLWRTAIYWLAAAGVAEALVQVIKVALHRPRPGALHAGVAQFSFPSGHATLSLVVYGFLAFLLCVQASRRLRVFIVSAVVLLIGLVAWSRLYLGVHWMSDVVGGLSFGTAWIAALAVAYLYQRREVPRSASLGVTVVVTFVIAAALHIAASHAGDLLRYAAVPVSQGRETGAKTTSASSPGCLSGC